MREVADNEIIKVLERCYGLAPCDEFDCALCPFCDYDAHKECTKELAKAALDLIKRQQAESESLNTELKAMRGAANSYKLHYGNLKAEIVREFEDRLIDCYIDEAITDDMTCSIGVIKANIHDIAREMENEQ